ncbi:MAG: glutathione synthase [Hyphomicrobiales bacterium]|uniref:glutathione synthase n=1 Tax=Rhabdaerophilum calidifontis TaxID=2604328 RepID=UPI001238D08C|nr:glutathione synthase [Rhabdaerophilum calidifontis]MCA1999207.1 glutathione synthase [Hyphomicrobiales bacterium]
MPLRVAVQMDPIERINIQGDSTFALMLEAQARGHEMHVYGAEALSLLDNRLTARMRPVRVRDEPGNHADLGAEIRADLADFDVVLMRQDPPFDLAYITASHLLERVHPRTLVVNDPFWVRNAPEKILVTEFPDLMPPTLISRDRAEIEAFRAEHGDLVMKPLYGNGGAGVFKVGRDDMNFNGFMDHFAGAGREPWMIQRFLPAVHAGDKRIILVDGTAIAGVNRVPAPGDIRSNMVRGGAAQATDLTPREHEICARIGPLLKERGLIFVGIDVIDGHLTEINVTSPTGIRAIKRLGGPDLAVHIWDAIERRRG